MKPYLFNTILGILAFVVLILPFTGKVHDGRSKWFKGFTIKGWLVCAAFILTIFVNYLKDVQADKDDVTKMVAAKIEKEHDDSISRKQNDESNAKIVNTFTSALAEYGLKYDSSQKLVLKAVRDSARKITTFITREEPNLILYSIKLNSIEKNVYHFSFTILSNKAASEHINIKQYDIAEIDNKFVLFKGFSDFFAKDGNLGASQTFT